MFSNQVFIKSNLTFVLPSSTAEAFLVCGLISSWKMENDKLDKKKEKETFDSLHY